MENKEQMKWIPNYFRLVGKCLECFFLVGGFFGLSDLDIFFLSRAKFTTEAPLSDAIKNIYYFLERRDLG